MEPVIQGHRSSVSIAAGQNESCQIFHSPVSTEVLLCRAALNSFFPLSEPVLGIALSQVQHLSLRAYRWRKVKTCILIRALRANPSPTASLGSQLCSNSSGVAQSCITWEQPAVRTAVLPEILLGTPAGAATLGRSSFQLRPVSLVLAAAGVLAAWCPAFLPATVGVRVSSWSE